MRAGDWNNTKLRNQSRRLQHETGNASENIQKCPTRDDALPWKLNLARFFSSSCWHEVTRSNARMRLRGKLGHFPRVARLWPAAIHSTTKHEDDRGQKKSRETFWSTFKEAPHCISGHLPRCWGTTRQAASRTIKSQPSEWRHSRGSDRASFCLF